MAIELRVMANYEELSLCAAELLAREIAAAPSLVLLAATGRTPLRTYEHLAARVEGGLLDGSHMTIVQLDEYVNVEPDDRRSLLGWTERVLVQPLRVPAENVVSFHSDDADFARRCRVHASSVRDRGGVDVAVLGLGPNGHLGFNEPPADPSDPTRVVELAEASIKSNADYWGSEQDVPTHAMTAGMDVILSARKIFLLVAGSHKAAMLRQTLEEPSPAVPASYLREASDVTIVADRAAWPYAPADSINAMANGLRVVV